MNVGIIDADLIGRAGHRFPNLCSMKISYYHKSIGDKVSLLLNYDNLALFDKIYISKVFTDTKVPENVLRLENIEYGGTGFFYDEAPNLPDYIEHSFPDYNLYKEWIKDRVPSYKTEFDYYEKYSIGFTTRGCFRQCSFCVNKNYTKVSFNAFCEEFVDITRPYICLLDDNILGYGKWEEIILNLQKTNLYFEFKQGMDIRIMTEKKVELLLKSKYKGDYIFAFDNIEDKNIIVEKIKLWRNFISKTTKLYIFCGFDREGKYDESFWVRDILDIFERIQILMNFGCLPYIMRFNKYEESPYKGTYINLARWANQPHIFKNKSYKEFCEICKTLLSGEDSATIKYYNLLEREHGTKFNFYFNMKFQELNQYNK